jgi:hypothetical protein
MMRHRAKFCKLISVTRESDFGWMSAITCRCDSKSNAKWMQKGEDCLRPAYACGNYLRRKSSEMSPETERNTSTASAPIIPKAIIIILLSRLTSRFDRQARCHSRRGISLVFPTREGPMQSTYVQLCSKMWANADSASELPCSRAHVRENMYVAAAKNATLQFFDVNGSVARTNRERRASRIQFSAHGGMAQRAGNLYRNIQRDAAVAGVRVEHRI